MHTQTHARGIQTHAQREPTQLKGMCTQFYTAFVFICTQQQQHWCANTNSAYWHFAHYPCVICLCMFVHLCSLSCSLSSLFFGAPIHVFVLSLFRSVCFQFQFFLFLHTACDHICSDFRMCASAKCFVIRFAMMHAHMNAFAHVVTWHIQSIANVDLGKVAGWLAGR